MPQGASPDGEVGLHRTNGEPTIFTIRDDGTAVVPNDPAHYGLTAAQMRSPFQLVLSSGREPWGRYPLDQPQSAHADFIRVRGSNQAAGNEMFSEPASPRAIALAALQDVLRGLNSFIPAELPRDLAIDVAETRED